MPMPPGIKHLAQAMIKRDYRASYSQVKVIVQPGEITRLPFASIN
jgi:hypothetical protein